MCLIVGSLSDVINILYVDFLKHAVAFLQLLSQQGPSTYYTWLHNIKLVQPLHILRKWDLRQIISKIEGCKVEPTHPQAQTL